jgi:16S rRNA (guanine(966)-N(2))-methyltransferase RsmD
MMMRVIAGSARGRRLTSVPGSAVRPTADRVKEALFSMLASRFELAGTAVLDLFAGSGGLGIEALSRGAATVLFVERDPAARRVLTANLVGCGFGDRGRVLAVPVEAALRDLARRGARFQGVLLDPPYGHDLATASLANLAALGLTRPGAWVAAEHHVDDALPQTFGPLQLTIAKRYGKTALALFEDTRPTELAAGP